MNIKNEDGGKWPASPCMIGRILYKGLLVDKAMGSVGIQVVRSMMPEGTSMSNPYKWRAWAKIEATQQDGKKISLETPCVWRPSPSRKHRRGKEMDGNSSNGCSGGLRFHQTTAEIKEEGMAIKPCQC